MRWFILGLALPVQGIWGDVGSMFRNLLQTPIRRGLQPPVSDRGNPSPTSSSGYSSAYPEPPQTPKNYPSYSTRPLNEPPKLEAMCPGSVVGCFQGHLRLCLSTTMKQSDAKIIRTCSQGCKTCGAGIPDVCLSNLYGEQVCETIASSSRSERSCALSQNGVVGCFEGPDVGYCFQSRLYVVDFCGEFGCQGNSKPDQCNTAPPPEAVASPPEAVASPPEAVASPALPTVASTTTAPQTSVSDVALVGPSTDVCTLDGLICHEGHIRLCLNNMPKEFARVSHDCRAQGCSRCENGPDLCNDETGQNVCEKVSPDLYQADCDGRDVDNSYCDDRNVRVCEPGGQGVLVEYCNSRSCQQSPAQCVPQLPPAEICQGSYVHCYQGNIRMCKDKQPIAESAIVHNCRAQGCSACPNAPPMCNNEQRQSQCAEVSSDRYVISCDAPQQGLTYCAEGDDVRYCDAGRASIVEHCATRGCQIDRCNPPGIVAPPIVGKGKAIAPSPASSSCGPRIRSEWGAMPDSARSQYIKAVNQLYSNGDMVKLAQLHFDNRDAIHGNGIIHFFLWHRVFVNDFEERLRALPGFECLTVPYWNYDYCNNHNDRRSVFGTQSTKLGQGETDGCIGGAFASFTHTLEGQSSCIRRAPNAEASATLANSFFVDLCQIGEDNFSQFSSNLQNAHGYPHVSYGGTFSTHYSPIDPLFFVHHANIDRIWDMWQDCHVDYNWYEALGLNTPVVAYEGITAADFIDNSQYRWKGNSYSVKYSSDQFQDPSVYSADFRRSILTRCRDGRFRRYDSPNPILGVDDVWARPTERSFEFQPGSSLAQQFPEIQVRTQNVSLQCSEASGTSDLVTLHTTTVPIAVYDNFEFQECVARCSSFYWKKSGVSNCVCMKAFEESKGQTTVSLTNDISIKRFEPACTGGDADYGFYQITARTDSGRRLLAMEQQDNEDNSTNSTEYESSVEAEQNKTLQDADYNSDRRLLTVSRRLLQGEDNSTNSAESEDNSTNSAEGSESSVEAEQNNTLQDDGLSPETDSDVAFRQDNNSGSLIVPNIADAEGSESSVEAEQNNTLQDDGLSPETDLDVAFRQDNNSGSLIVPNTADAEGSESSVEAEQNNTLQDDGLSPETDLDVAFQQDNNSNLVPNTADAAEQNRTSLETGLNVAILDDSAGSQETSFEASTASQEDFTPQQKQCFDVPVVSKNRAEILCSSKGSTPVALPRAWLLMNHLNPDAGPPCKSWKPAVGSKSIGCVNV